MMTAAEEKIIAATITCMEEYGLEGVTIRRIGEKAGMNSAAVNYYFRSKEALLERVKEVTLDNAFGWEDFAYTESLPLEKQLTDIFSFFALNALTYPRVIQSHFYDILARNDYNTQVTARFNAFLGKLSGEVKRKRPDMDDETVSLLLMQLAAASVLYFSAFPKLFEPFSGFDTAAAGFREKYVADLVKRMLTPQREDAPNTAL
ncbi:MAG: TetR/AcrR family transcriptional regulator [Oscillospiraceae bacterium]|jgi:AcrR family transcriptional regulator|nr:TetR/AcrR family transcriptional regulator [Oscillospiraceae bacterium]